MWQFAECWTHRRIGELCQVFRRRPATNLFKITGRWLMYFLITGPRFRLKCASDGCWNPLHSATSGSSCGYRIRVCVTLDWLVWVQSWSVTLREGVGVRVLGERTGEREINRLTPNPQTLHFIYLFNKYRYWIFCTCSILSVFSSSKCSLFHNANLFGFCIIHVLYTGCAKIKKKIIPAPKG